MAFGWMCHLSQNGSGQNVSSEPERKLAERVIWAGMELVWMCHLSQNGCWLNAWFEPEWQLTMLGVSAYCLCACSLGPAHFFAWGIVSDPVAQFLWRWWLPVIFRLCWMVLHTVDVSFLHIWDSLFWNFYLLFPLYFFLVLFLLFYYFHPVRGAIFCMCWCVCVPKFIIQLPSLVMRD